MFLRSLTLRGFKSFADKTTLEFAPGISVIVGPNGSGKSNIADAIAWALGEQGPRALRGGQMTDVIFAGSPARPALGMAEVKLVIDNSAGLIPVPASEIEISRAVFRSGEGEYRLGGRPCRLLDIQELLSDTGVGRAMHTIVSQGHLEDVLSARPEERRQFIEEAAGISKHRRRRERAERKLAGMEQDLLRLQDLVGEIKRQLRPLKQQAELAGRHEALTREADGLARKLAAARLRELYRDRDRRRPSWREAEARQEEARVRLQELDAQIASLEQERAEAEEAAQRAEEAHVAALRSKSEAEAGLRAAIGRESAARERLATAANRSGRLFALEEELERTERALQDLRGSLERRELELQEADLVFRQADRGRRDAEEERRRAGEEAAARRAESESLRRAMAGNEAEAIRLRVLLRELGTRISAGAALGGELEAEVERLDAVETPLAREQAELERTREELARSVADLQAEEKGLEARDAVLEARRKELSETPGMSFLRRRGERAVGVLSELVQAPPHLRAALRGALGSFADAVVYDDRDHAISDASGDTERGVLLAVPPDGDGPPSRWTPPVQVVPENARPLLTEVRPDPRVAALVRELLAAVYLVGSLEEAAAEHRKHPGAQFVTPDGAVVGPAFIRTPYVRDRRYEDILREIGVLERNIASVRRAMREGRQRHEEIAVRAGALHADLEETDRAITAAAEEMAQVEAEMAAVRREEQLVRERLSVVEGMAAAAREQLAANPTPPQEAPPLPPVPEPPVHLRVEVEALRRERSRLEAGVERTRRDVAELAAEDPIAMREALLRAEEERARAEEALSSTEANLSEAAATRGAAAERARGIQDQHAEANRAWREEAGAAEQMRRDHQDEDRARVDLERRIEDAERLLREGHAADPAGAVASLGDADSVEELQRQAETVARRMGLLGKVNLLATGELDSVQQRHDFVVRELDDVKAARRDLHEVIREVDRKMADLFVSAFDDVSREFAELFASLFPGGEGRLTLTDPADPLGSGIEVEARPGRKRVRRLSLLSGGERSLAALAFLFAIFRARPSPFYLMDEVEAALDDVNLHRFLEVVRGFAATSQILIVTHQKRTMEMADVLYGVSMGRDGASTVISQRLVEVAAG
jgi:chromosome segregation protein